MAKVDGGQKDRRRGHDEVIAVCDGNHEDHSQVNQTRFPDISRDELGRRLDGSQEKGEITSRSCPETELVGEDVTVGFESPYAISDEMNACVHEMRSTPRTE